MRRVLLLLVVVLLAACEVGTSITGSDDRDAEFERLRSELCELALDMMSHPADYGELTGSIVARGREIWNSLECDKAGRIRS